MNFEDRDGGYKPRLIKWPSVAGKGKGMYSPLEPPKGT